MKPRWLCIFAERGRLWLLVAGAALPPPPPVPLPRFALGAPRPSFAELLSTSLSQEGELRAWIGETLGYQQVRLLGLAIDIALAGGCPYCLHGTHQLHMPCKWRAKYVESVWCMDEQ